MDSVLIHVSYLCYVETYKHKHVNEVQVVAGFLFLSKMLNCMESTGK